MPGESGAGLGEMPGDLPGGHIALPQEPQDLPARGIGKGAVYLLHFVISPITEILANPPPSVNPNALVPPMPKC